MLGRCETPFALAPFCGARKAEGARQTPRTYRGILGSLAVGSCCGVKGPRPLLMVEVLDGFRNLGTPRQEATLSAMISMLSSGENGIQV
jgi:hypothetical protein